MSSIPGICDIAFYSHKRARVILIFRYLYQILRYGKHKACGVVGGGCIGQIKCLASIYGIVGHIRLFSPCAHTRGHTLCCRLTWETEGAYGIGAHKSYFRHMHIDILSGFPTQLELKLRQCVAEVDLNLLGFIRRHVHVHAIKKIGGAAVDEARNIRIV